MGKEKILIFDTCKSNIDILIGILAEFDFKILKTSERECFLKLLNEHKFDLIFYDVQENVKDEIRALKKAANSGANVNSLFLLMSDFKLKNTDLKLFERNIISNIQKPFNIELIKTIMRSFICSNNMKEAAIREFYDSLADFVHDLKTPLVARDYASKILLDDLSCLTDSQKEVLNELHLSTKYLLALTNNFLAKYKYENSKIVLSKSLRDIVLDLREVVFEIKYFAKSRACAIKLEAPDECFAQYDEIGIKRIFYNLLINAIKYSPKNSEIKITLAENASALTMKVENYAEDIEKAKFKNIFKKFVSCGSAYDGAGFGIGLAISRKIAKMHKGNIVAKIENVTDNKSKNLFKITFELNLPNLCGAIRQEIAEF